MKLEDYEKTYYVTLEDTHGELTTMAVVKRWYETRHMMERRIFNHASSMGKRWRYATLKERKLIKVQCLDLEKYIDEHFEVPFADISFH